MRQRTIFISKAWPWVTVAVLWGAAASLACVIVDAPVAGSRAADSIAERILGRCVNALAAQAYDRADLTFHKGRPHSRERAFSNDVFQVWRQDMAPTGHAHMSGDETKEIMAWLRFATLLDPHNITYRLDAAYWLMSTDINRPDAARKVLLDAGMADPHSYLVYLGMVQFATKTGDRLLARRSCDRALELWPGGQLPGDDEERTKMDKRELLMLRVLLREMDGDTAGAIADLKSVIEIFPNSPQIRLRIRHIESGQESPALAEQWWNALKQQEYHHVCEEHSGEHAGHEEETLKHSP